MLYLKLKTGIIFVLNPLLFNLVMKERNKDCRRGAPWNLLYADDPGLTAE